MDLEMPGGEPMKAWFASPQTQADGNGAGWLTPDKVLAGDHGRPDLEAAVDDNVRPHAARHVHRWAVRQAAPGGGAVDTPAQRAVARTAATESIVLLKNTGDLLPLDAAEDSFPRGDRPQRRGRPDRRRRQFAGTAELFRHAARWHPRTRRQQVSVDLRAGRLHSR